MSRRHPRHPFGLHLTKPLISKRLCLWYFINRPDKLPWPKVSIPQDQPRAPWSACWSLPRMDFRYTKVLQVGQDVDPLSPRGSRSGLEAAGTATVKGRSALPMAELIRVFWRDDQRQSPQCIQKPSLWVCHQSHELVLGADACPSPGVLPSFSVSLAQHTNRIQREPLM